jgi:hypothetical protein
MALRGDDPLKIEQRCGHTTFGTTELSVREAEAVERRENAGRYRRLIVLRFARTRWAG